MASDLTERLAGPPTRSAAPRGWRMPAGRYIEAARPRFPRGLRLDGLQVVVDCAHGAAYRVAPTVLWELGAEVIPVGVAPDGFNINQRLRLDRARVHLQRRCVRASAPISASRSTATPTALLMSDERGELIDGDQILALIARSWRATGRLAGGGVVATVMSNLGLERFLSRRTG